MSFDEYKGERKDGLKWLAWVFTVLVIFGFIAGSVGFCTKVASTPAQVVRRVIDPDNMLQSYRWFHDASASLDLYPNKIAKAKSLAEWAEAHAPERAMARQTELTGLEQTCLGLVGDYNSRAARLDSGFFRNPERWLPVSTEAWTPLPPSYASTWCNENS